MDVDELIDDLTKLRTFKPTLFKKKLYELRLKDLPAFNEVVKIMGIREDELESIISKNPEKIKIKKARKDNSFVYAVLGSLAAGFAIIAITIFFILPLLPQTTKTNFNATQSLIVGYELFTSFENNYIQYSFEVNQTIITLQKFIGREYYLANNNDFTSIVFGNKYFCTNTTNCVLTSPNNYELFKKQENLMINESCNEFTISGYDSFNPGLMIYSEAYYHAVSGDFTYSEKENNMVFSNEECVPLILALTNNNNQIDYFFCINNEGVPLVIEKLVYGAGQNISSRFTIENIDEEIIKKTNLNGRTIDEWNNFELNC